MSTLRCCPRCRLLQADERCVACGDATLSPTESRPFILYDPQAVDAEPQGRRALLRGAGAPLWVAGGAMFGLFFDFRFVPNAYQIDVVFGIFVMFVFSMLLFRLFQRPSARLRVRGIPVRAPDGHTRAFGRVRAVDGAASEGRLLLRCVWAGDGHELFLRELRKIDFIVDCEDGRQLMVAGEVHATDGERVDAAIFGDWAPFLPRGAVRQLVVRPGDRVCVEGDAREEQVADGYRDGKQWVLRGTRERPVMVYRAPLR